MTINDITELLKQAYMEEQWDSVLECINLLVDFEETHIEDSANQHDFDETDF
jgi:hypothetical protein